jgi:hypothetical protein
MVEEPKQEAREGGGVVNPGYIDIDDKITEQTQLGELLLCGDGHRRL